MDDPSIPITIVIGAFLTFIMALGTNPTPEQINFDYAVVNIDEHYVLLDPASSDWVGNKQDAKVIKIGNNRFTTTSLIVYETKPDQRYYEYTAEEFAQHICGPDADWRCPHSGHEPIG